MAKRPPASVQAFQFVFDGEGMKQLCASNPKKVLFTVSIETKVTTDKKKVGTLRIVANGVPKGKGVKSAVTTLEGCPIPPCIEI